MKQGPAYLILDSHAFEVLKLNYTVFETFKDQLSHHQDCKVN